MQAINPIEMVMEAVAMVQKRFYEDYPPHPKEKEYNYKCSSTMKPTQVQVRDPCIRGACRCLVQAPRTGLRLIAATQNPHVLCCVLLCCVCTSTSSGERQIRTRERGGIVPQLPCLWRLSYRAVSNCAWRYRIHA